MKTLEFILILVLIIFICGLAFFNRLPFNPGSEWQSEAEKTGTVTVVEAEPDFSRDIYSELPVTRMQFLVVLSQRLGLPPEYGDVNFKDIDHDSTGIKYIYPMINKGLITGYPDHTFRPNEYITKNEAEIIMAKALKYPVPPWAGKSPYLTGKMMCDLLSELEKR